MAHLLLLVQHDVGLEACDAGELLVADGAGEVARGVRRLVQSEVELHVERLRALVAAMRLRREKAGVQGDDDDRSNSRVSRPCR